MKQWRVGDCVCVCVCVQVRYGERQCDISPRASIDVP